MTNHAESPIEAVNPAHYRILPTNLQLLRIYKVIVQLQRIRNCNEMMVLYHQHRDLFGSTAVLSGQIDGGRSESLPKNKFSAQVLFKSVTKHKMFTKKLLYLHQNLDRTLQVRQIITRQVRQNTFPGENKEPAPYCCKSASCPCSWRRPKNNVAANKKTEMQGE